MIRRTEIKLAFRLSPIGENVLGRKHGTLKLTPGDDWLKFDDCS